MLTRRHIRIKVMQSVYSYTVSKEKKVEDEIAFFKESVAKTFDLYLLILGLLKAIKQYVIINLLLTINIRSQKTKSILSSSIYLRIVFLIS